MDSLERLKEMKETKEGICENLEKYDCMDTITYNSMKGQVVGLQIAIDVLEGEV